MCVLVASTSDKCGFITFIIKCDSPNHYSGPFCWHRINQFHWLIGSDNHLWSQLETNLREYLPLNTVRMKSTIIMDRVLMETFLWLTSLCHSRHNCISEVITKFDNISSLIADIVVIQKCIASCCTCFIWGKIVRVHPCAMALPTTW